LLNPGAVYGSPQGKEKTAVKEVNGGWWLPSDDEYFTKFFPAGIDHKRNGFQREHLLEAFKFVKRWNYAIDVGAHVGFWAKDMAERFKHVYCFEPSPNTYACLLKNMAGYDNVVMSPIALGEHVGTCSMSRDDRRASNSGSEYIVRGKGGEISVQPLDALQIKGCDFLKIDVEGGEYHVLKGGVKTIQKYRPVVIMETDKNFSSSRFGVSRIRSIEFLRNQLRYREVAHMRPDRIFIPAESRGW
jgi:FkbM family methyltransferase